MSAVSRKNIYILAFTLLVVMLGYGMVMPVMPFLIGQLGAGGKELGWLVSTYSLMQMLCAPLWGSLSDRVGRKLVLAVGIIGYAAAMLFFGGDEILDALPGSHAFGHPFLGDHADRPGLYQR